MEYFPGMKGMSKEMNSNLMFNKKYILILNSKA